MKRIGFLKKNTKPMKRSALKTRTGFKVKFPILKNTKLSFYLKAKSFILTAQQIADSLFSQVIRRSNANNAGLAMCVTCGIVKHWKDLQCGHYIKRQHLATRYLRSNVGVQCEECNCFKDGEEEEFAKYLNSKYGPNHVKELKALSKTIVKDFDYQKLIEELQVELKKWSALEENTIHY